MFKITYDKNYFVKGNFGTWAQAQKFGAKAQKQGKGSYKSSLLELEWKEMYQPDILLINISLRQGTVPRPRNLERSRSLS